VRLRPRPSGALEVTDQPLAAEQRRAEAADPPDGGSQEYYFKKFIWAVNYHLPVLPLVLSQDQNFLNMENWTWPTDHEMWQYFDISYNTSDLHGMGEIRADPDNPKEGANVVER